MRLALRWPLLLVVVLIVALGVLATLQVRWIGQVNEAQEQRLRAELKGAAARFSEEIDRELVRVISSFEMRKADPAELAERYKAWSAAAHDSKLIASVGFVEDRSLPFGFDAERLALVLPLRGEREREGSSLRLLVQFDARELTQHLIPDTARRYFNGFDVAVTRGDTVVYRSSSAWPSQIRGANPDLAWPLLLTRRRLEERGIAEVERPWRLLIRHHGEPLAEMFAAARRRDLAVAFTILLLLAASVVILAAVAHRAERLRRQQLEFVAGITHELNTPLAALASAGQNLADGLPVDIARYGQTIVKETRRLIDLVDQVLQFGGMEARTSANRDEAVDAHEAIDDAIAQCCWLAEERRVQIESRAEETLPVIRGDRAAVTRAVQNLIANAIRHGGAGGWVGVRAGVEDGFLAITVEDRGSGIAAADLPHLFEPFYRGRNAQTRGSGLGLTIVDRVARAHGGSVTVARRRERGAEFTLRLPASRSAG